jgi:hypothetical protein
MFRPLFLKVNRTRLSFGCNQLISKQAQATRVEETMIAIRRYANGLGVMFVTLHGFTQFVPSTTSSIRHLRQQEWFFPLP